MRAAVHARKTLLAGFTTVRYHRSLLVDKSRCFFPHICLFSSTSEYSCFRDLGTEGAFDSDIGLRKCLSGRNALIPGPRYYCVTRALISTGSYGEFFATRQRKNK